MGSALELRIKAFCARPPVRRTGIVILAVTVLIDLALMTPALINATSFRVQAVLAAVWLLGVVALLMLVRFWRHISKETGASPPVASNNRWRGP
jgi:hypothetical protein